MHRITLLAALSILAGCVSPQARQAAEAQRLFSGVLVKPIVADSILREGDVLSFQLSKSDEAPAEAGMTAQLEASCVSAQASLLYFGGQGRRYLGVNNQQYTAGQSIPSSVYPVLKSNPGFIKACAETPVPDWRVVRNSGNEPWLLIDRNSLKTEGAELKLWVTRDYSVVALDEPYSAPFSQKREHLAIDCTKQTYRLLTGYALDTSNTVTDGKEGFVRTPQPMSSRPLDDRQMFTMVCDNPQSTLTLPRFVARIKKQAPVQLPPLADDVAASIKALNMPPPIKMLNYLEVVGQYISPGRNSEINQKIFIETDPASQQLSERSVDVGYEHNQISFRGMFSLTGQMYFTSTKDTSVKDTGMTTSLTFHGDWQHMPVNGSLGYNIKSRNVNSVLGETNRYESTTDCTVVSELSAIKLHDALSGTAKELKCRIQSKDYVRTRTFYYLQDYGYFYFAGIDKNPESYETHSIKTVR